MSNPTMTLADGTVIDQITGRQVRNTRQIVIPTHQEAVQEVTRVRKRVHDLPEPPEKMNVVALVAMYHMFGLNNMDIAYVTGLTEPQVERIRELEAFSSVIETAQQNIVEQDAENVRNLINAHATSAVETVVRTMDSEDEKAALVAAKDILDRAGHRPADVVEHRHKVEGGLTIEYVKKDPALETPVVDVTAYTEEN